MIRTRSLLDVADVETTSVSPDALERNTAYLGLENLARLGGITRFSTVGQADLASSKFVFTSEHVLLGKLRPLLRKVAYPGRRGVCSTDIYPLRPGPALDGGYLYHFLRTPGVGAWLSQRATGANLPRVSRSVLKDLAIPIVPLEDQRRIAALLDQVDELRAKRRRTLALLEDLRAARLQQFLERSKCSEVPFGSFISDLRYGSSSKAADHGSLVMRIPNVQRGALWLDEMKRVPLSSDETGTFALLEGDLLMVRSNGSPDLIGRAAAFTSTRIAGTPLASESVVFASYLLRVRLSPRALPAYVEAVLASSPLRRSIRAIARTSAGQYNLNGPAVRNLPIPLPPLADQQQVVAELETISAAEADHRTHLTKLDELFASLQHRAFTGRL